MKKFAKPILVTRPYLPPKDEFKRGIDEIWANKWLTNTGPMLEKFQHRLAKYLKVPETNIALFNNGTLALELGYYAMGLSGGEVITTPFTFVATSHALKRIGAKPVFADIDPKTLCLDPKQVEKLITSRTKAIVPVHVYGNACDVKGFERLSKKYKIPVIYDAAHAFGAKLGGKPIANYGAMSMFSFHSTKLFHSGEGGCLIFKDKRLQKTLLNLKNFAIESEVSCTGVGTNAKMNEFQALMGLCSLNKIDDLLVWRKKVYAAYKSVFDGVENLKLLPYSVNKAYVPILFKDFKTREKVYKKLKTANVFARRYFYPTLTDFAPYRYAKGSCPIAEEMASRVLTLPTYYGLSVSDVKFVAQNVIECLS